MTRNWKARVNRSERSTRDGISPGQSDDGSAAFRLVTHMSQLSGANIANDQIPTVEAGLTLMKCARCHTIDRLKELALSPQQRWDMIVRMMKEPGPGQPRTPRG